MMNEKLDPTLFISFMALSLLHNKNGREPDQNSRNVIDSTRTTLRSCGPTREE